MNLQEGDYVCGLWFVNIPPCDQAPRGGDWMGSLVRKKGETKNTVQYRFRWYKDERIFDHEDTKNWYSFTADEPMKVTQSKIGEVAETLARAARSHVEFMEVKGGFKEFMAAAQSGKFKWMHVQALDMKKPEDRLKAEAMGLPVPPIAS